MYSPRPLSPGGANCVALREEAGDRTCVTQEAAIKQRFEACFHAQRLFLSRQLLYYYYYTVSDDGVVCDSTPSVNNTTT